ncbi:hypothetical protein ColLi_10268 [Colletotrichum liriopes]|uniref:Uncharacterized protein n=1 Tax=Colletotrichum liriopes TaxID=708192 RepID=A0AA37LVZ6_9PEZI|nr:hypothetical protein ColLi_10268 [Colletotrichum liriopes]
MSVNVPEQAVGTALAVEDVAEVVNCEEPDPRVVLDVTATGGLEVVVSRVVGEGEPAPSRHCEYPIIDE